MLQRVMAGERILVSNPQHPHCLSAPAWTVRSSLKGTVMHTGHPVVPSCAGTISCHQLRDSLAFSNPAPSYGTP